jgi:hypothetical protein
MYKKIKILHPEFIIPRIHKNMIKITFYRKNDLKIKPTTNNNAVFNLIHLHTMRFWEKIIHLIVQQLIKNKQELRNASDILHNKEESTS